MAKKKTTKKNAKKKPAAKKRAAKRKTTKKKPKHKGLSEVQRAGVGATAGAIVAGPVGAAGGAWLGAKLNPEDAVTVEWAPLVNPRGSSPVQQLVRRKRRETLDRAQRREEALRATGIAAARNRYDRGHYAAVAAEIHANRRAAALRSLNPYVTHPKTGEDVWADPRMVERLPPGDIDPEQGMPREYMHSYGTPVIGRSSNEIAGSIVKPRGRSMGSKSNPRDVVRASRAARRRKAREGAVHSVQTDRDIRSRRRRSVLSRLNPEDDGMPWE